MSIHCYAIICMMCADKIHVSILSPKLFGPEFQFLVWDKLIYYCLYVAHIGRDSFVRIQTIRTIL